MIQPNSPDSETPDLSQPQLQQPDDSDVNVTIHSIRLPHWLSQWILALFIGVTAYLFVDLWLHPADLLLIAIGTLSYRVFVMLTEGVTHVVLRIKDGARGQD